MTAQPTPHELIAKHRPTLDQALEDFHYAPWGNRLRNWRWARTARTLLREAESA